MASKSIGRRFARWRLPTRSGQPHHERTAGLPLSAYFQWTVLRIRLSLGIAQGESLDSGGDRSSAPVAKVCCCARTDARARPATGRFGLCARLPEALLRRRPDDIAAVSKPLGVTSAIAIECGLSDKENWAL